MAKVIVGTTMSLDGFINDRNGSVEWLYPDLEALRKTEFLKEDLGDEPVRLKTIRVMESPGRTDIKYRVIK
jgi:hypothetical protein